MKRFFILFLTVAAFAVTVSAEDKPVSYDRLPKPAKTYIEANFPGEKVSFATKGDDIINPDYTVMLMNGTKLEFQHSGALSSVSSVNGIPSDLVPVSIRDYVQAHYPDAGYVEYEIGRHTYEVKLTNRMELKFNRNFHIIEVDD